MMHGQKNIKLKQYVFYPIVNLGCNLKL